MAERSIAGLPPPSAHSRRAAEGTASRAFMMSGGPGGPHPSMPHTAQVDGRNCMGPMAPAVDGPSLAPSPLSISLMAASTVQDRPGQYSAADSWYSSRKVAGVPAGTLASTGRLAGVTFWYDTRFTTWPPAPIIDRTSADSVIRSAPGALIRTAKFFARPSCADLARPTTASAPRTLSSVAVPNG